MFSLTTITTRFAALALVAACALVPVGCHTVPYTNRSQLNVLSTGTEAQMGLQAYQEVLGTEKIISNGAQAEMVRRVASRIAAAADRDAKERGEPLGFEWQVVLIDSPQVNAWCMPGGKMGVYTGILPITKTEAGLAVVMGHEVSHALARHGGERVTQQVGAQIILQSVDIGLSQSDPATHDAIMAGLGAGAQVGVLLPFSRSHESEADHIGIILMAKAGYDPHEAPKLWERMAALGGEKPPEFLSTHPSDQTRIQQLNAWLPEAQKFYNPNAKIDAPMIASPKAGIAPPPVPGSQNKTQQLKSQQNSGQQQKGKK